MSLPVWRDLSGKGVKPTLSLDFDGVINPYSKGWDGGKISDPHPNPGTLGAMERLARRYRLVVTTARTDHAPVKQALSEWGLDHLVSDVSNTKPPAVAYVDDRALNWANWDQAIDELQRMTGDEV